MVDTESLKLELERKLNKKITVFQKLNKGNSIAENYIAEAKGEKYVVKYIKIARDTYGLYKMIKSIQTLPESLVQIKEIFLSAACFKYCFIEEWIDGKDIIIGDYTNDQDTLIEVCKRTANSLQVLHNSLSGMKGKKNRIVSEYSKYKKYIIRHGIEFRYKDEILAFLNRHIDKITIRPNTLLHRDIHIRNLLLTETDVKIVDLENLTAGDPWRDFAYAVNLHISEEDVFWYFVINYYFEWRIPDAFWKETMIYCLLQFLRMAICEDQKKVYGRTDRKAEHLYKNYAGLSKAKPKWYTEVEAKVEKYEKEVGQ